MICVVDEKNIIVNILDTDTITESNQRKGYPWSCLWEKYTTEKPLAFAEKELVIMKERKITSLKAERDNLEVEDITVDGNTFDYDEKARERINNAIIALQASGTSIHWTLADNTSVEVTAEDLIKVVSAVAIRSNALHVAYRTAKEKVMNAETVEEVEAVELEVEDA